MSVEFVAILVFPALMIFAAAMDMFTMTIPNRVSLGLLAGFACIAPLAGLGWEAAAIHAGVGLAVLAAGFAMFAAGWMGGGDAKLLAAASVWMGTGHVFDFALFAAAAGGALALLMLFLRMFPLPAGLSGQKWMVRLHEAGRGIPYGIALAAGGIAVYPNIGWVQALY